MSRYNFSREIFRISHTSSTVRRGTTGRTGGGGDFPFPFVPPVTVMAHHRTAPFRASQD
jgi:hypothetical protein